MLQQISTLNLQEVLAIARPNELMGLYVHVPFCNKKCGYCDFYSITNKQYIDAFVNGVLKEIEIIGEQLAFRPPVNTIFFGGGTPTLLNEKQLHAIVNQLSKYFNLLNHAEWTIEANPGTVDKNKLAFLRTLGFNRMSLGVQSFHEKELQFLERIHNADQAEQAVHDAWDAGFSNINLDLMCAFQGQTPGSFKQSLKLATALPIQHISCYTLIFEQGTPFYRKMKNDMIHPLSESDELAYYEMAAELLDQRGFIRYEISNFHSEQRGPCLHNLRYWHLQPYLGFGPSAHSYLAPYRWSNVRHIQSYITSLAEYKIPIGFSESLSLQQQEFEYIFLGLRLPEGISLCDFKRLFNVDFVEKYKAVLDDLVHAGFAKLSDTFFRLTEKGLPLAEELAIRF